MVPRAAFLMFAFASCAAYAQNQAPDAGPLATATLPQSNEAMLLSDQAEQAARLGDHRLAIGLIQRIQSLPDQLVAAPASRTYYPVWREAFRLQSRMPPKAAAFYQGLFDAEIRSRYEQARQRANLATLRELFQRHRASSHWESIGRELAGRLIDRRAFGEALEVLQILLAEKSPSPDALAMRVVSLGSLSAWEPAERALRDLNQEVARGAGPAWRERTQLLQDWVAQRMGIGVADARAADPALAISTMWSVPLGSSGDSDVKIAEAVDFTRRLPVLEPLIAGEMLLVRSRGVLCAVDSLTLTVRWRAPERSAVRNEGAFSASSPRADASISADSQLLLTHPLRHAISAGSGYAFTIESLSLFEPPPDAWGWQGQFSEVAPNVLVARDLHSGEIVWEAGSDASDPLFGVAFQDRPLLCDLGLCVPVQRGNELFVAVLDAKTGRLLRDVSIVGPPTYFSASGGRCLIDADETTLYICTGNGVIAALSRSDLSWKWAATYPSTISESRGRRWWNRPQYTPREYGFDRPVMIDDLLVLAPVDSPAILAFDRFDGRQRWPAIPRGAILSVAGAVSAGLVVVGNTLTCLDPADGQTVRWRSVPLEVTGRAIVASDRVYVPVRDGLVVADGRTGKIVHEPVRSSPATPALAAIDREAVLPAAITMTPEALFAVSPNGIVKYPDLAATRASCERRRAAGDELEATLALAWTDALESRFEEALAHVEKLDCGHRDELAAARARLLTHVFVGLARDAADSDTRLAWLRRATALSLSETAGARLGLLLGAALEETGASRAAFDQYVELLGPIGATLLPAGEDPQHQVAVWISAAERLRKLLESQPVDDRIAWLSDVFRTSTDLRMIERARFAAPDDVARRVIDDAIIAGQLPYERLALLESQGLSPGPGLARRWALLRWAMYVALGDLKSARAAEAAWNEYQPTAPDASAGSPESAPSDSETDLLAMIKIDLRKLEDNTLPSFDAASRVRAWRKGGAELILDGRSLGGEIGHFFLTRDLAGREIHLVNVNRGSVWRRTRDMLVGQSLADLGQRLVDAGLFLGGGGRRDETPRPYWPAATYGRLAAVPVDGGLICVGMAAFGSDRRAGARLWEFAIPEWRTVPPEFSYTVSAGPLGVYVLTPSRHVVLIGWSDGRTWWDRDLSRYDPQTIDVCGDSVVLFGREMEIITLDSGTGALHEPLDLPPGSVRGAHVVRDRIVAWTDSIAFGIDPSTRIRHWSVAIDGVSSHHVESDAGWIALRDRDGRNWSLRNVSDGTPVLPSSALEFGDINLIARDGDRLLACVLTGEGDELRQRFVALDLADGRTLWSRSLSGEASLNRSQLIGHPHLIPVLIQRGDAEIGGGPMESLAIEMIDKRDGSVSAPLRIGADFLRSDGGACERFIVVTPSRVIVQANGAIAAWGPSPLGREP